MLLPTLPRMQAIMTADTRKDQNECRQYGHARFVALRPRLRRLSNGDPTLTKSTSRLARRGKPVRHEQWISHLHLVEPEIRLPLPGTYFAGEIPAQSHVHVGCRTCFILRAKNETSASTLDKSSPTGQPGDFSKLQYPLDRRFRLSEYQ